MWFIFSLFTILAWGVDNVFQKLGTNPKDLTSHWKIVIWVGLIMGLHATGYILVFDYSFDPHCLITYLPVSAFYIASMTFSYVGLRYMELSIVSPVCNSSGAVAALLCFVFLHQTMTWFQLVGVILVCGGIGLLGYFEKKEDDANRIASGIRVDRKYQTGLAALIFPLLYCVLDGLGTFADALVLDRYLSEEDALLAYEFTFLICAVLAFFYIRFIKKTTFVAKEEGWKCLAGVSEMLGQFFYIYAIAGNAVLAAPMISSYCVISVILSRIFLKEKLTPGKYTAIIIVMIAIAILGIE